MPPAPGAGTAGIGTLACIGYPCPDSNKKKVSSRAYSPLAAAWHYHGFDYTVIDSGHRGTVNLEHGLALRLRQRR